MRIAVYHNLPSGGGKRALLEWVKALSHNHVIDVFSLSTAEHDFCDLRPFVNAYSIIKFTPRKLYSTPFGRLNQYQRWMDLKELTTLQIQIAAEIDRGNYDVCFANTCMVTSIPIMLQYVHTPALYYLHESFGSAITRNIIRPYYRRNYLRDMLDRIDPLIRLYKQNLLSTQYRSLLATDLVVANSNFTRSQMMSAYKIDTPVCPYGVETESFYPLPGSRKEDIIISVGEMTPRKGFDFIIQGLSLVQLDRIPKLVIASNNVIPEEEKYILNIASGLGVEVQLLTHLNTHELHVLYNKALFCVYAPIDEPFGLVPLEAMACGIPVIGVREGGIIESVIDGETGLLVERSPEQFAQAVKWMVENPQHIEVFGDNSRRHILLNWTWDRSIKILEGLLLSLID